MSDAVFCVCVMVLVILCAGDPDLLDAIIHRVGGYDHVCANPSVEVTK